MHLNTQLINGVLIDWSRIDEASYLRNIAAISGVEEIRFDHSVTFFVGENGSGKGKSGTKFRENTENINNLFI